MRPGSEFLYMDVPEIVGFLPKSSILMGVSIIFTIHFGVLPLFFGNPPYFWESSRLEVARLWTHLGHIWWS